MVFILTGGTFHAENSLPIIYYINDFYPASLKETGKQHSLMMPFYDS